VSEKMCTSVPESVRVQRRTAFISVCALSHFKSYTATQNRIK